MLFELIASLLLLKLGEGKLSLTSRLRDMQSDPESYPHALRIVAYSAKGTIFHHSCIGVLLTRSVLIASASCVQSQKLTYLVKSYKVDELDMTPLLMDTFPVDGSAILVAMNDASASHSEYAALVSLRFPVPVCQIDSEREYSVVKLPVNDVSATNWTSVGDSSIHGDCIVLWYNDREEDEVLYMRQYSIPKWSSETLTAPHTSLRNDGGSYNGGVSLCRDGDGDYLLIGMSTKSSVDFSAGHSQFVNENAATGYEQNFPSIREALPQLKNKLLQLEKLQELIDDNEACDAFYGFNKNYPHTLIEA